MHSYRTVWNHQVCWINVKESVAVFTLSCKSAFNSPLKARGSECHRVCHLINLGSAMGLSTSASALPDSNSALWWEHPCVCHYNLKHHVHASCPRTPSHAAQCCSASWLTRIGFYRLHFTSPAKPVASGVRSLHGRIWVVATRSIFYPGRKQCTLQHNLWKTSKNNFFFTSVTE